MKFLSSRWLLALLVSAWQLNACWSDEPTSAKDVKADAVDVLAGHSTHGEAFNDGPRQAAYLMDGMGSIQFEISTSNPLTKKFFVQGVAQLHGFWYYEAERSFRQAAVHDKDCAMCYWGMALANVNNRKRAASFIEEAKKRKENASERERMFIDAAHRRFQETVDGKKPSKKDVAQAYTRDLEEIVLKFPEDVEAQAFLALQLWENERNDLPIVNHVAINAVLEDVFDKQPMHPAHHYRIHLWDKRMPSQALRSAAMCGPALPGIAHMWHMPGHTYSNLNRFQDAVWQQEASARVDHAHMMRDHVMPDQIHNFAHNNEWMIRNLLKIGRIKSASDLATNMISLPRHPKYNSLKSGSAKYGRERYIQSLSAYRLWSELASAIQTGTIDRGDTDEMRIETLRHEGIASAFLQNEDDTQRVLVELRTRLSKIHDDLQSYGEMFAKRPDKGSPPEPSSTNKENATTGGCDEKTSVADKADSKAAEGSPTAKASSDKAADPKKAAANAARKQRESTERKKELEPRRVQINEAIAAIEAAAAAMKSDWKQALKLYDRAGAWDSLLKVEWLAEDKRLDEAVKLAKAEIKKNPNTVLPTSVLAYVRWKAEGAESAKEDFDKLRDLACSADLETPMLARLSRLAQSLGYGAKWNKPYREASDVGQRPALDTLGPFRYSPYDAPAWKVESAEGDQVALSDYAGRPVLVIFYLGFGCLHCMEQLQAFSPKAEMFRQQGIEVVAISNETTELLNKGLKAYDKKIDITLNADPTMAAFKAYRCFDDFEQTPLHGTFLISPKGKVLWQDISFEPFMDADFLLKEAKRLLISRNALASGF